VIRGEESVPEQLDSTWQQVNLQTKWEFKPVFSYAATGGDLEPENPSSGSAPIITLSPNEDAVTSQEGPNAVIEITTTPSTESSVTSQEDPIAGVGITTTPSTESSFCRPQHPKPVA
jgi:hypothetical protein